MNNTLHVSLDESTGDFVLEGFLEGGRMTICFNKDGTMDCWTHVKGDRTSLGDMKPPHEAMQWWWDRLKAEERTMEKK